LADHQKPLPAGWRWVRLGELCEFIRGVSFDKSEVRTNGLPGYLPVLRAGNIHGALDVVNDLVWVPEINVSREQRLRLGDIAICMSSGSPAVVGKTAQLKSVWSGSVGAFCGIIRPRSSDMADYLGLWFRSPEYAAWRDGQARGANIQNLRFSQFEILEIPVPTVEEQKRIAAILNEQMTAVERARAAAEAQLEAAKSLPAAYLRAVFSSPEAQGWQLVRILEVADRLPTGIQYERSSCKAQGRVPVVDQSERGYIGYHDDKPGVLASENHPIVTFANHTCAVRLHKSPFSTIQNVFPLRAKKGTDASFLFWLLKGRLPPSFYGGHWPKLTAMDLPFPPLEEQRRIAAILHEQMRAVERARKAIEQELDAINKLPAALLRRAFNGEL